MPCVRVFCIDHGSATHNSDYLYQYYSDLKGQRFDLIITDPMTYVIKYEKLNLSASENNVWVEAVVIPTMCAYENMQTYTDVYIQILKPRINVECPVEYTPLELLE